MKTALTGGSQYGHGRMEWLTENRSGNSGVEGGL